MPNKMPPLDKKLLEKLKGAWGDGLNKSVKDPEKYLLEIREQMDKGKPLDSLLKKWQAKSKKKQAAADAEMVERLVARYESED